MSTIPPDTGLRQEFPCVIDPEWEAMMARGEEPETPAWHLEELDRIEKSIADGTATFSTWEEVKARLQKKYGMA